MRTFKISQLKSIVDRLASQLDETVNNGLYDGQGDPNGDTPMDSKAALDAMRDYRIQAYAVLVHTIKAQGDQIEGTEKVLLISDAVDIISKK
jgi:hypothetical protein